MAAHVTAWVFTAAAVGRWGVGPAGQEEVNKIFKIKAVILLKKENKKTVRKMHGKLCSSSATREGEEPNYSSLVEERVVGVRL